MAEFNTKQIRNLALLGHGGCGKTSVAEAMLYVTGAIDRLGNTAQGNTTCDYDPEARARGFSLAATPAFMTWKDTRINVLDTPGFLDFTGEVRQAVRVADAAVICVDGKAGVEVGTELAWDIACEAGIPRAFFVNKCDDEECKFERVFRQLHATFGVSVCPVFIPVETGKDVTMIDLLTMRPIKYDEKGNRTETAMRIGWEHTASEFKDALNEALAGTADELMEKFFEGESFTLEESVEALHNGIIQGTIVPVYCGSAVHLWGIVAMLDAIAASFPRPTARKFEKDENGRHVPITTEGDPALFVYKTVADPFVGKMSFFKVVSGKITSDTPAYNSRTEESERMGKIITLKGSKQEDASCIPAGDIGVVTKLAGIKTGDTVCSAKNPITLEGIKFPTPCLSMAVKVRKKGDEEKVAASLLRLLEEDPTISFVINKETREQILSGLGEQHLDVIVSKLKNKFGVEVDLSVPKVAYRESIRKKVEVQGRHKKQSGGHGQFGDVFIRFEPCESDDLVFAEEVVGGSVPKNFFPAVEKGLRDSVKKGVLAGYPMVGIKATLYDGSYHPVDSSEMAFKTAANIAYKNGIPQANPVILEPIGTLKAYMPDENLGDIMGDVTKRRGRVLGMGPSDEPKIQELIAEVPMGEMGDFSTVLRSVTAGRGWFTLEFTRYEDAPPVVAQKVIEEAKANDAEADK